MSTVNRTVATAGSVTLTTKNTGGQLITPVSAPTVSWYTDAGRTTGVLALPVTGSGSVYTASWTGPQAPVTAATRYLKITIETTAGVFSVDQDDDIGFLGAEADFGSTLCTLAEAKAHLNIPAATTTYDAELAGFIDAATPVVEDLAGPILPRTITGESHDGGYDEIITLFSPVIAITSITEYLGTSAYPLTSQPAGSTVSQYGYELVDDSGIIARRNGAGQAQAFPCGRGTVSVTYTAGYSSVPANVRLGALELIRHWWQFSQQGGRPSFGGSSDEGAYYDLGNYAVPHFVAELLTSARYSKRNLPGIA